MKIARARAGWMSGLLTLAIVMAGASETSAQTKMPSMLRYGSGLWDVPVASVLPHMTIIGTYSGFSVGIDEQPQINAGGDIVGFGDSYERWLSDASVTVGLFDRVELGATFQNFSDGSAGGTMIGGHGRFALIRPETQGIGLAAGLQVVSAPSYDGIPGSLSFQPSRLGHPDHRLYESYGGGKDDVTTTATPYAVATAMLRGFDSDVFPQHDLTLSVGWGRGTFSKGDDLDWYAFADSEGWFFGSALHMKVGDTSILNLIGEWNGFDVNLGAQLDFGGVRVGGFLLGANYAEKISTYRSKKFGILGSVALCPNEGGLCKPGLIERIRPDTIRLPAPPPDTVVIERTVAPALPTGTPVQICLATGQVESVLVTAQGDTLVGNARVPIDDLRPGVVFAGTYADGARWYEDDEAIRFETRTYSRSGNEARLSCGDIMRVGEFNGVPLFADDGTSTPYTRLYVPVRPGVWQPYESGLQRTRGDR